MPESEARRDLREKRDAPVRRGNRGRKESGASKAKRAKREM